MPETRLFAPSALLPDGWAENVLLEIGADGNFTSVVPGASSADAPRTVGPVLPGMPNLHSHAFQRAMAGLAERAGPVDDSFWTWREVMYGFLQRLLPYHVKAIAAQLYIEMLHAGYTAVGEFHYLHHDAAGRPYGDLAEMSNQVLEAAQEMGIGMTLLPVLYGHGGFGGQPVQDQQRRFQNDPDRFLRLLELVLQRTAGDAQNQVGIAPHSLRAVTPETLQSTLEGLDSLNPGGPVHIHVAEQMKEVDDCLDWSGQRPVEWLLGHQPLDERWCLVHATHMDEAETTALAKSGAVAGLCPTTEANLGDGLFPAPAFLAQGGRFGIGSDSHISVSPIEELRWLEYGQRLITRRRNLLAEGPENPSVGARLYKAAVAGGAQALGRPIGRLEAGCRADLVVLDPQSPRVAARSGDLLLDAMIFAGNRNAVYDVMVGGRWRIKAGQHPRQDAVRAAYLKTLRELRA